MAFADYIHAWGHVALRTWDRRADERLWRLREREGQLNDAISALVSEGYRPRKERVNHNLVVNAGFDLLLSLLNNEPGVAGLQYVALGDSTTAALVTDTQLGNEISRIALSSSEHATNDLTASGYWGTDQANQTLAEGGLFGGAATAVANSGTLYSHVEFIGFTKDDLESLTAQWDLGFSVS